MKRKEIATDNVRNIDQDQRVKLQKKKKKRQMILSISLAAVLLLTLSVWGINSLWNTGIASPDADPGITDVLDPIVEDKVTILLLGLDGGGTRSDTIMLATLDCKNNQLSILSIPRDTRVPRPNGSGYMKINEAHAIGGTQGTIKTVNEITGIPINYYAAVEFEGFRKIIDALGGVEIDVPNVNKGGMHYEDPEQDLYIHLNAGLQRLNGEQAEGFVRYRSGYPEADIARTRVQRDFLKELIRQHATLGNVTKIGTLYEAISPYIKSNIKVGDAVKYAKALTKVPQEQINMMIIPGTTNNYEVGGVSYYLYNAAEMEKLANQMFWSDVKLKPTPKPTSSNKPTTKPVVTVAPTATPTPEPTAHQTQPTNNNNNNNNSNNNSNNGDASATPRPTQAPAATPTPEPEPTPTPTPEPTKTPAKSPTPTHSPSQGTSYPPGL